MAEIIPLEDCAANSIKRADIRSRTTGKERKMKKILKKKIIGDSKKAHEDCINVEVFQGYNSSNLISFC